MTMSGRKLEAGRWLGRLTGCHEPPVEVTLRHAEWSMTPSSNLAVDFPLAESVREKLQRRVPECVPTPHFVGACQPCC